MQKHGKRALVVLALALAFCGACLLLVRQVKSNRRQWAETLSELESRLLSERIHDVASGKTHSIVLPYGPRGVDRIVQDMGHLAGLQELTIEDGDITASGMASIAAVPNLREFALLGGTHLGNRDLESLRGKSSIERLVLVYKDAHHEPLPVLAALPNLTDLTIFDRNLANEPLPTEQMWYWLDEVRQLRTLQIGGAAVTDECVRHLRAALPHTAIRRLEAEPAIR